MSRAKMPTASKRRKLNPSAPEEIVFDPASRTDYLTGFHKRKQARIKHAQEVAEKRAREERIKMRAELRKERKEHLEAHVTAVNRAMKELNGQADEDSEPESEEEDGNVEWEGFEDPVPINREDEYIDEDKYTTVKVEEVGITRYGFVNSAEDERGGDGNDVQLEQSESIGRREVEQEQGAKKKRAPTKEKKKRKKFRYESKGDRKTTQLKERVRRAKLAQGRRGKKS